MSALRVSILLPTYNGAPTLERAVKSVRSQSFSDWELLIMDDGSTDNVPAVAARLSLEDSRVVYSPSEVNLGIQRTLNRGLKSAKGEFIARIDDDDEWSDPEKLRLQIEYLDANPGCVLIGTAVMVVDEFGRELFKVHPPLSDADIRRTLLRRNCFTHSSVVFRKEPVLAEGGYGESEEVRHVEDYDLWLRLGRRGTFANLPELAVRFTMRPGNISSRNKTVQFRRDISLVWAHRKEYPDFFQGMTIALVRFLGYGVFRLLPPGIQERILARYKSI